MNQPDKVTCVESILTRAADSLNDVTPLVMALYYQRFPEAQAHFQTHSPCDHARLEGEMVERSLYCLMNWVESPGEVEILLLGSVPHHGDTLRIPPDFYQGLLTATADVIGQTIPPDNRDEREVWEHVCRELGEVIATSRQFVTTRFD